MRYHDIQITGSLNISGSITIPVGGSNKKPTSPPTGSIFLEVSDSGSNLVVFNGSGSTGYQQVGVQTVPVAPAVGANLEYLVVAGGGGGGARVGGGGGAGGFLSSSLSNIISGSSITVTVGAGGSAGTGGANGQNGGDGGDSSIASAGGTSFSTVTSTGGGGGNGADDSTQAGDGGSGGGSSYGYSSLTGGSGTVGQGNDGGDGVGSPNYNAGGGGGKSEAGEDASGSTRRGDGGSGSLCRITGVDRFYAGGGGGGNHNPTPTAGGGAGGPGGGGSAGASGGKNVGIPGGFSTGGGGGGGSTDTSGNSNSNGAAGGSGVVIFSYPTSSITATGGVKTSRSDGQFVHTFKSSGTLKVSDSSAYTVPSGDYFNIIKYTGDDSNDRDITGLGFKPDFVWIKRTNSSEPHALYDSNRGVNKQLSTDSNGAQATNSGDYLGMSAFLSDGFNVGNNGGTNRAPNDYVAYCWKANGGTTTSNSDGDITSTVQANQAAGFSITTYTNNGSNSARVGHGLGTTPKVVLIKKYGTSASWHLMTTVIDGSFDDFILNSTSAPSNSSLTAPTSTTFAAESGGSGETMICYAFADVAGHQKFGTYTGTGSSGQAITTGFRPGFILIKSTVGTDNWRLYDTTRGITDGGYLEPNTSDSQNTNNAPSLTITDTGFEIAAGGVTNGDNASGNAYFYWAIAN